MGRYPDFLFIGAMKCATTTLSAQLGVQPGIFMVSDPKEIYFFSYDHYYERGMDWYLAHFESAQPDDLCGEAATTYTQLPTYPHAAERIYQQLPNTKLIYIMRHPIDRLLSQYMHEYSLRKITVDINQAIYQHPALIQYSSYAMQLEPYLDLFGKQQVLPSFFERVCSHPQEELERICEYVGYPKKPQWDYEMSPKNVSKNRVMKTPVVNFLRRSPALAPVRDYLVPQGVKQQFRKMFAVKIERPEIAPEQMDYLKSVFDADLAKLGGWLGVELTCDNFKSVVQDTPHNWADSVVESVA